MTMMSSSSATAVDPKKTTPPPSPTSGKTNSNGIDNVEVTAPTDGSSSSFLSTEKPTKTEEESSKEGIKAEQVSIGIEISQPSPAATAVHVDGSGDNNDDTNKVTKSSFSIEQGDGCEDETGHLDEERSSLQESAAVAVTKAETASSSVIYAGGGRASSSQVNQEKCIYIDEDLDELMDIDNNDPNDNSGGDNIGQTSKTNRRPIKYNGCLGTKCFHTNIPVGKSTILSEPIYRRTKLCIVGPTWPGCIFTVLLLVFSSNYYVQKAYNDVGIGSACVCIGFTIIALLSLFFISCCDPGIVRDEDDDVGDGRNGGYRGVRNGEEEGWRYCDFCSVYQPPTAAHCPDCNVCIEGYDHHCPWMGTCIGKRNMRAFMIFNFTWLSYLIYAVVWVSGLGPILNHRH